MAGRPVFHDPIPAPRASVRPVAGMICISPLAPAPDCACAWKDDS